MLCTAVRSRNLLDIIASRPDLQKFYTIVDDNEMIKFMLRSVSVTVFAPTDVAWDAYRSTNSAPSTDFLYYHISKSVLKSHQFRSSLAMDRSGYFIFFNKRDVVSHGISSYTEYFANQARIIEMDITGEAAVGQPQVLHIIDEVLVPTLPTDSSFGNPSAFQILENPMNYSINQKLSYFKDRVVHNRKEILFQGGDGLTFFIPIDGNTPPGVWAQVDDKVIDGHIIPNKVYFSRAFPSQPEMSSAFIDSTRILLSLKNETFDRNLSYTLYAQSSTVISAPRYPSGSVLAKIIKADIPVKNGVVHLIENPLIIVSKNLLELLQQYKQLSIFHDQLLKHGEYLNRLRGPDVTIFAPSNDAFNNMLNFQRILNNDFVAKQMMKCHLTNGQVTVADVISKRIEKVPTIDPTQELRFFHDHHDVKVIGGGISATITTSDIRATNGILHIINKVMCTPYNSVFEKLASDPDLSDTFKLGNQQGFNEQFKNFNTEFTYFAPNNVAWETIRRLHTSEHYKLFGKGYSYHVKKILDRHLIVDNAYTIQQLLAKNEPVQMVAGKVRFNKEGGRYYMNWDGKMSEIIEADVEVGNGIVHVVKDVLFKESDLTTSKAPKMPLHFFITFLLSNVLFLFIA